MRNLEIGIRDTVTIGNLVARSQAKRLCNQLKNARQVVLDFDDISDIGQGYAHELFVVFAKQHPDIKLETKNTSRQVERMINHVKKS